MTDAFDRLKTALADGSAIEEELGAGGMATVYVLGVWRNDDDVEHVTMYELVKP